MADELLALRRSSAETWKAVVARMALLAEHGADPRLNAFKLLRHTGGASLWELRAGRRPASRILFTQVPGEEAYLMLSVVPKAHMAGASRLEIERALQRFAAWMGRRT